MAPSAIHREGQVSNNIIKMLFTTSCKLLMIITTG